MTTIFEAAHKGDVAALRSILDGGAQGEVNSKDENGNSALIVAAKEGHSEVVQELLARGADRHEALAQGLGQTGSPVAALLNDQQHTPGNTQQGGDPAYGPIPTDIYGGYQLQDGSIAYGYPGYPPPYQGGITQPAFYHDPVMFPHPHMQPPYAYPPQSMNGVPRPRPSPNMHNGHGRKPSAVGKYPPAEVAKTIPCRFYPNCRNGTSCIFAHIDSPIAAEGQSASFVGTPTYPVYGAAPPPPHASFYSAGPYAPNAAPFYPAMPVTGAPFNGQHRGPLPLHYQPHEASQPGQLTSEAPKAQDPSTSPQASSQEDVQPSEAKLSAAREGEIPGGPVSEAVPNKSVTAEPEEDKVSSKDTDANAADVKAGQTSDAQPSASGDGQDRRRRQSFNSFLHSHAVPFQPSQMAAAIQSAAVAVPLGPAASMNGMHGMSHHLGSNGFSGMPHGYGGRGKMRGRGGVAGMGGRGPPRERTPCTFFAKDACKYGPDCLYPHILPDGTDARYLSSSYTSLQPGDGLNASSSSAKASVMHAPNQPRRQGFNANGGVSDHNKADVNGETIMTNGSASSASPPSAPASLDSQAKKAAGLPPTPSAEVIGPSAYGVGVHSKLSTQNASAPPSTNGFVPSKPSATALADAAAAAPIDSAATVVSSAEGLAPSASSTTVTVPSGPITGQQKQQQLTTHTQSHQRAPQHPSNQQRKNNVNKSSAASQSTASAAPVKKSSNTQRVPSGADFPALGGGTSSGTSSTQTSAATPPQVARKTPSNPNAGVSESDPAAPSAAAAPAAAPPSSGTTPKINFSAILSAPAPAKKAAVRESTSAPNGGGSDSTVAIGQGPEDDPVSLENANESAEGRQQQQMNGDGRSQSQDAHSAVNGHAKDAKATKAKPLKVHAGSTGGKVWGSKTQTQASQSGVSSSKEPEVDEDDFVIVKRNHGKRTQTSALPSASNRSGSGTSNGATSANFASVVKTSVAA